MPSSLPLVRNGNGLSLDYHKVLHPLLSFPFLSYKYFFKLWFKSSRLLATSPDRTQLVLSNPRSKEQMMG